MIFKNNIGDATQIPFKLDCVTTGGGPSVDTVRIPMGLSPLIQNNPMDNQLVVHLRLRY